MPLINIYIYIYTHTHTYIFVNQRCVLGSILEFLVLTAVAAWAWMKLRLQQSSNLLATALECVANGACIP